jgi:protein-tyrosine phosphatase
LDEIPDEIYQGQDKFSSLYSEENQKEEILNVYVNDFFEKRLKEFEETKTFIKNNNKKDE